MKTNIVKASRTKLENQLLDLLGDGFDRSFIWEHEGITRIHVGCWQCEAMVVCGVPCHEAKCPNQVKDEEEDYEF